MFKALNLNGQILCRVNCSKAESVNCLFLKDTNLLYVKKTDILSIKKVLHIPEDHPLRWDKFVGRSKNYILIQTLNF